MTTLTAAERQAWQQITAPYRERKCGLGASLRVLAALTIAGWAIIAGVVWVIA